MQNEINPYVCKVTGATFRKPCTVQSCFANVRNLNKSGVNAVPFTNCSYVDFQLAGFDESLDYAVEEQGFIGYRDLQYMSPFLKTHAIKLRDIYTGNVDMVRKAIALLWALKNNHQSSYCENCGHPLKQGSIRCTSATMCEERKEVVENIIKPFIPAIKPEDTVAAYNVLWRSLTEKFMIPISLSEDEVEQMDELRIKKI